MSKNKVVYSYDELTRPAPVKTMCDPILWLIRIWGHSFIDVLCFGIIAGITTTVIDMDMSPHRCAHQIAKHRGTVVVR